MEFETVIITDDFLRSQDFDGKKAVFVYFMSSCEVVMK